MGETKRFVPGRYDRPTVRVPRPSPRSVLVSAWVALGLVVLVMAVVALVQSSITYTFAFGELRGQTFGQSEQYTTAGWTAGFGAEVMLAPSWSAKIEYLYVDLSSSQFAITGMSNGDRFGVVRAGVNYHF